MPKTKKNNKPKIIDFYKHINNNWINTHKPQLKKHPIINTFEILEHKVNKEMENLLLHSIINKNHQISKLYNSFININELLIHNYIFQWINEIKEIIEMGFNKGVYKLLAWGYKKNIAQLININISVNEHINSKY